MRTRLSLPLALTTILVASAPSLAAAQRVVRAGSDSAASVPADLALALAMGWPGSGGASEIVVGGLPAAFPSDLSFPATERVLGGATFRGGWGPFGGASIAAVATRTTPDSARVATTARLERSGWRRPEKAESRGGFVPSMGAYSYPSMLCRDSLMLTTWATARAGGGSLLRLSLSAVNDDADQSPCEPESERPSHFDVFLDVPMPSLLAPPGADGNHSGGSSNGPGSRTSTTRLRTSLRPAEVVSHYAAQLREAGWTLRPALGDDLTVVQAATHTDGEGRLWHGTLLALALPGGEEVDVSFSVARSDAND